MVQMVEDINPGDPFSMFGNAKAKKLVCRFFIICTILRSIIFFDLNHTRFGPCKRALVHIMANASLLMQGIILYEQFMTFMQTSDTVND